MGLSEGQAQKSAAEGQAEAGLEECRKWFSTAVLLYATRSSTTLRRGLYLRGAA